MIRALIQLFKVAWLLFDRMLRILSFPARWADHSSSAQAAAPRDLSVERSEPVRGSVASAADEVEADARISKPRGRVVAPVVSVIASSRGRTTVKLATVLAVIAGGLMSALFALSFFSVTTPAQANTVVAGVLPQGSTPTASVSPANGANVTITFPTVTVGGTTLTTYTVTRYTAPGDTPSGTVSGCTLNSPMTMVSCTDAPGDGQWTYTDTPTFNLWVGSASPYSNAVTVDSTAPSVAVIYPVNGTAYGANWGGAITGTASDSISGISSVAVSLQQGSGSTSCWTGSGSTFTASCPNYVPVTSGTTAWSLAVAASVLSSGDSYHVVAQATNGVGTIATSSTVSFSYSTAAPTVAVTYPAAGTTYGADWTGTVTGTASSNSGAPLANSDVVAIENTTTGMWWDTSTSAFDLSSPTYNPAAGTAASWTFALAASKLSSGDSYSVRAQASDVAGNTGTSSAATFTYNTAQPTVAVTYPLNGSLYGADWTGTITGTASSNSGASLASSDVVAIENTTTGMWWDTSTSAFDLSSQAYDPAAGSAANWTFALAASKLTSGDSYSVQAQATDSAGNTATSSTVTFRYNSSAPSVAVTYPLASTTYGENWTGTITGTASSNSGAALANNDVVAVENTATGKWWDSSTSAFDLSSQTYSPAAGTAANWTFALAASKLTSGDSYNVVAGASDVLNNAATSSTVTFTYSTAAPSVAVTFPSASSYTSATWTGSIVGTASSNAGAGTSIASAAVAIENTTTDMWWDGSTSAFDLSSETFVAASGTTNWSLTFPASNLTSGDSYGVVAKAVDSTGNSATSSTASFSYGSVGVGGGTTVVGAGPTGSDYAVAMCPVGEVAVGGGYYGGATSGAVHTYIDGPVTGATLATAVSGTGATSLSLTGSGLPFPVSGGDILYVGTPGNLDSFTVTTAASAGATSVSVETGTNRSGSAAIPAGSYVFDISSTAWRPPTSGSGAETTTSDGWYILTDTATPAAYVTCAPSSVSPITLYETGAVTMPPGGDEAAVMCPSGDVALSGGGYGSAVMGAVHTYIDGPVTGAVLEAGISGSVSSLTLTSAGLPYPVSSGDKLLVGSPGDLDTFTASAASAGATTLTVSDQSGSATIPAGSYVYDITASAWGPPTSGTAASSATSDGWYMFTDTGVPTAYVICAASTAVTISTSYETGVSTGMGPTAVDVAAVMCPAGDVAIGGGGYSGGEMGAVHTYFNAPVTGATLASQATTASTSLSLGSGGLPAAVSSGDTLLVGTPGNLDVFTVATAASAGVTSVSVSYVSGSATIPAGSYVFDLSASAWRPSTTTSTSASVSTGWYVLSDTGTPTAYVTCSPTAPTAPVITSGDSTTFTVGSAGSFQVTASGTPAPTFSYTGSLPAGVTLSASGLLSGTPAAGTVASYPITITANNAGGNSPGQSFTLTVQKASPTITVAAPATGTSGTAITAASISATLAGSSGSAASGTITFSEYYEASGSAPSTCTGAGWTTVGTETPTTAGDGTYDSTGGVASPVAGEYWWYASFAGDSDDAAAASLCNSASMTETVVSSVSSTGPTLAGVGASSCVTSSSPAVVVDYPASVATGDLLLLVVANGAQQSADFSQGGDSTGWSAVSSGSGYPPNQSGSVGQQELQAFWAVAGSGNSVTARIQTNASGACAWVLDYKGISNPVLNGTTVFGTANGVASLTPSTFTTTAADTSVISLAEVATPSHTTPTVPSLSTSNGNAFTAATSGTATPGGSSNQGIALAVADQSVASAGPVTSPVWNESSTSQWAYITLAFSSDSLVFTNQVGAGDSWGVAGTPMAPQPVVTVEEPGGATDTSYNGSVTLTGTGSGSFSCPTSTTTVTAVNGVATFAGCQWSSTGTSDRLTASSSSLPNATSNSFTIATAPSASGITFTDPSSTTNNSCTAPAGAGGLMWTPTPANDFDSFPNAICDSDGNAGPGTFSWEVELATGTPALPTAVVTSGPIVVTVTAVTPEGTNGGKPPTGPALGATATIPAGSAATSSSFEVGNIGGGDWIAVTASVTIGGSTYTLEMQVH